VEISDAVPQIEAFLGKLQEIMQGGLITVEPIKSGITAAEKETNEFL
jgi:PII-like signaling protein